MIRKDSVGRQNAFYPLPEWILSAHRTHSEVLLENMQGRKG